VSGAHGGIALITATLLALNCTGVIVLASARQAFEMCEVQRERDQRDLAARSGLYLAGSMILSGRVDGFGQDLNCAIGPHRLEVRCRAEPALGSPGGEAETSGETVTAFSVRVSVDGVPALECLVESFGGMLDVKWIQPLPAGEQERVSGR
jgi:hypothetical protein